MKYALITGGSRGIGREIAVKLAAMGYHTLINYRSNRAEAEHTLELITQAGGTGELLAFDVANREETFAALDKWQEEHPEEYISVLVNNAGITHDNMMLWMMPEEWQKVVDTSLNGFYHVTQPLLKKMLLKKQGRIINIASVSGLQGSPGQVNYSAAKGGLIAASKTLAKEVARKRVTVNVIAPGYITTDMTDGLDQEELKKQIPAGRLGRPQEIAELAGFLASEEAGYINGAVITIDGGLTA